MDSLEKNLNKSDYEVYKRIKSSILNKYSTYHRNFNFSKPKGLITYVDSLLNRYATLIEEDDFNVIDDPINRKITNISSIASSQKDAEILANVVLDFISNSEAAIANGLLKFIVYSIMYCSDLSQVSLGSKSVLSIIIGENILPRTTQPIVDFFTDVLTEANNSLMKKRSDILYSILNSCFNYAKKLILLFSRTLSEDVRLKNISYKQSIAFTQSLMNSLSNIFIADFFSSASRYFNSLSNFDSNYYVPNLNNDVYSPVKAALNNIYTNNNFSFNSSSKSIGDSLIFEIKQAPFNVIPDLTEFNTFIDNLEEDFLLLDKNKFKELIFYAIKGV